MGCGASVEAPIVPFMQTITGHLVNAAGQSGDAATVLTGKVKVIYFANHGTGYQFAMTYLTPFLTRMKQQGRVPFEVIFVSSDADSEQFKHHLAMGPWWGVPWEDTLRRGAVAHMFQVTVGPALVLLDERDGFICSDGVQKVHSDPYGQGFPHGWGTRQQQEQEEGGILGGLLD